MRDMYDTPEQHAANGPETWTVEKNPEGGVRGKWVIIDLLGNNLGYWGYQTKREAVAASTDGGAVHEQWTKLTGWYAGETPIPGRKAYAEVLADIEAEKARERRKIEKLGVDSSKVDEWKAAVKVVEGERKLVHDQFVALDGAEAEERDQAAADAAETRMEALNEALETFASMLELLTGGTLVDTDMLNEAEASELHSELSEVHSFGSAVEDRIHRIAYLGLDSEKTTLEVLYEMRDEESDLRDVAAIRAA